MGLPTGILKAGIHAVTLSASVLLTVAGTTALPYRAGSWVLLALLGAVVVIAAGVLERPAVRLVTLSRPATAHESRVLAAVPALGRESRVLVHRRTATAPIAVVGRHLVVSAALVEAIDRGRVTQFEATALTVYARGHHRVAAPRAEVAVALAQIPWRTVAAAFGGVVHAFAWVPLGSLAWRLRGVVGVVCVVQSVAEGPVWPGVLGAVVVLLTYLHPAAARTLKRRAEVAGDRVVIQHDLGPSLVAVLQRNGHRVPEERLQRLQGRTRDSAAAGRAIDALAAQSQPASS